MRRLVALGSALALVLVACGGATGGGAPAATATAVAPVKMRIAFSNVSGDLLPVWAAKDAGIFSKDGVDAELVSIDGGARTLAALLSGDINVGVLGGSEALSATAEGASLKVVAVLSPVFPYLFMAAPEVKTMADMKGKKVGISSVGGSADIATHKVLLDSGLDADKDVTLVVLGSHAQRTAALFSGAIQAAVDDPPNTTELADKGFHNLYDLAAKKVPSAQTAVVVKAEYAAANREGLQRLVDSLIESVAWIKKNKAEAEKIMRKYYGNSTKPGFSEAIDFFVNEVYAPLPFPRPELWADTQTVLAKKNPKVKDVDIKTIADPSFVQSAADRGVDKR